VTLLGDRRKESLAAQPATVETIILVHGTYGNKPNASKRNCWWYPGSEFCARLDDALERRGINARTWKHLEVQRSGNLRSLSEIRIFGVHLTESNSLTDGFSWSGDNSELARRIAAAELASYISDLEMDPRVSAWHLIGHSHGGNVIRRAIRDIRTPPMKGGVTVFLGTPILNFDDEGLVRNFLRRVNWPILLVLPWLLWMFLVSLRLLGKASSFIQIELVFIGLIGTLVSMFVRYYIAARTPLRQISAVNLIFPSDEAIGLLRKCSRMITETHVFLHQVFAGPEDHLGKKERLVSTIASWPMIGTSAQFAAVLCLLIFARPYRPGFRMFFSSRLEVLKENVRFIQQDDYEPEATTSPATAMGAIIAPLFARLPYLLFIPFDCLFGCFDWLLQIASRLVIWSGIRFAARTAFGIDVLGSAFCVGAVTQPVKGISDVKLDPNLEAEILGQISRTDTTRQHLADTLRDDDFSNLIKTVKLALEHTDLLHAQYYQNVQVIERIADILAG
jgi:hypothetical protein